MRSRVLVGGVCLISLWAGSSSGEEVTVLLPGGVPLVLVRVPAGAFMMGSPATERGRDADEGPQHRVTISNDYFLGKFEVTQRQWVAVMGSNPSRFASCGLDCPVERVSWNDVCGGTTGSSCAPESFIGRLNAHLATSGFRLPTEAEWERATRSGASTSSPFSFPAPSDWDIGCGTFVEAAAHMFWCNNAGERTHPVGELLPNPYGLHDEHGNVWEWVADRFAPYPSGAVTDPAGPAAGADRVFRGGSWGQGAMNCRSARRHASPATRRDGDLGFRLAASSEVAGPVLAGARVRRRLGRLDLSVPAVTTAEVYGITAFGAFAGGDVTADGGAAVTSRGVCWSTEGAPTVADGTTAEGAGTGSFTSHLPGLLPGTTYRARAYATSSVGTGYGNVIAFSTLGENSLEYLGQAPPGDTLTPFAPGIVPGWFHAEVTASPDGGEIYWVTRTAIYTTQLRGGVWTPPRVASFCAQGPPSGGIPYDDVPVVSPDDRRLFFLSMRPVPYASPNRENIWYVNRTPTGWSDPHPLPQAVNATQGIHWQVSVSNSGTLYFGAFQGTASRIFLSRLSNGEYSSPEPLTEINSLGSVGCPFIAADETYIIFAREVDEAGILFVSFKGSDGSWLQPRELFRRSTSFVSRDGKYFFTGHYWMSARIIEDLRP